MCAGETVLHHKMVVKLHTGTLNFSINRDLKCWNELLEDNNLFLNISKTKSLLFTIQRQKERDCNFEFYEFESSRKGLISRNYFQIPRRSAW